MNKDRRKQLASIRLVIDEVHSNLGEVRDAEQEVFDNIPESLQGSEKGERVEAAVQSLEEAIDALDTAMQAIDAASE
jgi:prefoldin subunit 5